jgi:hypothetical protein
MGKMFKKVTSSLLIVPLLLLGIGVASTAFNTQTALAFDCNLSTGLPAVGTQTNDGWIQRDGSGCKTTNPADNCQPGQGLTGAINANCASGEGQQTGNLFGNGSIVNNVINIMLFIIGILCVIMIIYGGIRYVISRGETEQVKNAKNTILYAIVGLIVAIVAYALVNWVFTSIGQ